MTVSLTDPHLDATRPVEAGTETFAVPRLTEDELPEAVAAARRRAAEYCAGGADPLAAVARAFQAWQDPAHPLRRVGLPALGRLTGFHPETIARFGLWPLSRLRPSIAAYEEQRRRRARLVRSGEYRRFTRSAGGFLRGYGEPGVTRYPPAAVTGHILAGNVVGPAWLSVVYGAVTRGAQLIKVASQEPLSVPLLLHTIAEMAKHPAVTWPTRTRTRRPLTRWRHPPPAGSPSMRTTDERGIRKRLSDSRLAVARDPVTRDRKSRQGEDSSCEKQPDQQP